jgi:PncC family amidohydrolase
MEETVGRMLLEKQRTIACAESCTGGLLTSRLTDIAGSSAYVMGSVVSYTNEVKADVIGVDRRILEAKGAVSEEVARQMAEGVRTRIHTDIGVGITGIAGPGGGTADKPVGLVYIAVSGSRETQCTRNVFIGKRREIKFRATQKALDMIRQYLLESEYK